MGDLQDPKMEVPTIEKAYLSGLNFREYPHKISPIDPNPGPEHLHLCGASPQHADHPGDWSPISDFQSHIIQLGYP